MEIRTGEIGRITAGDEAGKFVRIDPDADDTGGYFILIASKPDMSDCFDHWVENKEALHRQLGASGWLIEWL